ncbi:hypothetical protein GCM10010873_16060 [Cypionkella aquatica]|uniref:Uncharacterized protein n=2 Tax=Cypionkella aquatica TaxID=1756042 RepID=A0AA37TSC8_9RHOB|nr:hypothetical protein GCM10010873_16060 [Cypionkella aquatica]
MTWRPGVSIGTGGWVSYQHLLFDRPEIVFANAAASESLFLGAKCLAALTRDPPAEVMQLCPDLQRGQGRGDSHARTARLCADRFQARLLA